MQAKRAVPKETWVPGADMYVDNRSVFRSTVPRYTKAAVDPAESRRRCGCAQCRNKLKERFDDIYNKEMDIVTAAGKQTPRPVPFPELTVMPLRDWGRYIVVPLEFMDTVMSGVRYASS
jgi:hypothetical protein